MDQQQRTEVYSMFAEMSKNREAAAAQGKKEGGITIIGSTIVLCAEPNSEAFKSMMAQLLTAR